jgi:hypothetical protein
VLKDECGHILIGRKIEVEVVDAKPHCLIGKQVKTINYES